METETVRRRVEMITAHFSAADNISATAVATHVFPLNCSSGLTSINRRLDNRMNFARQDSKSQAKYMRQVSNEQGSSELVPPMFSQPASINSNVPKVREILYAVKDYSLPSSQPPKFARTTLETDVPMKFIPYNNTHATKGVERKQSPRMDVAESGGKYILLIELPGVSKDDIRVEVNNTTLTVQTTKGRTVACSLSDSTGSAYHKREILEGPFEIMWPLPFDVNPDSVSAEFLDGLLRITIPKLRVPVW
ncbi:hypothetical protein L2E82_14109 [Cichorium intybus]|uniref:Uncharacterized protein n=1 Tax=Cichorium intybus TaxID=13427 RepID=A0ACB9EZG6_CICIN|nr:hypothetical protein L2E82_14109 [Cichorium intybus]